MVKCDVKRNATDCTVGKYNESVVAPVLQFVTGLLGNAVAIFILIRTSKSHKWKPFYRLVLALTLIDSTVSVTAYPIVLKRYISHFTYCFTGYECKHVAFIFSFAFLGSALLVTFMSFDRFIAIVFPSFYSRLSKNVQTSIYISTTLVLAIVVCTLPIAGVGQVKLYYPESWCFIDFSSKDRGSEIITCIYSVLGIIIFIATAFMNIVVVCAVLKKICRSKGKLGTNKHLKSDVYIVVLLVGIVIDFSICWVPITTRMLYNVISSCPQDGKTELLVARLAITNSIVDPFIYIVLRKENFEYLERLVRRLKVWRNRTHPQESEFANTSEYPTTRSTIVTN